MAIGKGKKRVMITLDNNFVNVLQKNAEEENRSLSNYIETLLKKVVDEKQA